jgi:hypothetical protein
LDRLPARPQQLCRDSYSVGPGSNDVPTADPIVFYDGDQSINLFAPVVYRKAGFLPGGTTIPAGGSIALTVEWWDSPDRDYELLKSNTQFAAPRLNYLYSIQTGAAYATMFVVQKGLGAPIEVLLNFQWNLR